jgi:hypothetical protein
MKLYIKLITTVLLTMYAFVFSPQAFSRDYSQAKAEYQKLNPLRFEKWHTGAETAQYLTEDYANTAESCDGTLPAFLCSGVVFRGTGAFSTSYHSWDPSPASQTSGGVSFSYLRKDSKYSHLAYNYNNGFIFYNVFWTPDNPDLNDDIDIMCSFPIDAATDGRSNKGCGASSAYPNDSGPCQDQGILTADQWYSHYVKGNSNHQYQCGFTTSDNSSYDTADGFYQTILSMKKISSESFNEQNELRLATWGTNAQNSLPIQAFFYLNGSSAGLSTAQQNQQDFYNSTTKKIWVPVIKLTLPTSQSADATFTYSLDDQLVPEPQPVSKSK